MTKILAVIFLTMCLLAACSDGSNAVPRRTAYPRVEAYGNSFTTVAVGNCELSINTLAHLSTPQPGWLNADYTRFGATLHLTVTSAADSAQMARTIDNRLQRMSLNAGDIPTRELTFTNPRGFQCRLWSAQSGNTPLQIMAVGPSTVVSGVVAFNGPTEPADSLAPILQNLEEQMVTLLQSLRRGH